MHTIGYLTDENLTEDFNFDTRFMLLMELEMECFLYTIKNFLSSPINELSFVLRIFNWDSCAWILFDVSSFKYLDQTTNLYCCNYETAENRKKKCTGNEFCEAKKIDQNVLTHPTPARPKITCLFPDYARAIEYL